MSRTPIARAEAARKLKQMIGAPNLDSQEKIAKRAGVSQKTVSNLSNEGNVNIEGPTLASVEKVAHALDMEAWELLKPRNSSEAPRRLPGRELTSTQNQVLDYLRDPEVADALLKFLRTTNKPGLHRGKVRLHGKYSSTSTRKGAQRRKGSPGSA